MVIASPATARTSSFLRRLKFLLAFQKLNHTVSEGGRQAQVHADMDSGSAFEPGKIEFTKWRKLDSRKMGINRAMIPISPWIVLKVLQNEGFEAYLVGGCVRDLLLNRAPKDFDVITTAALAQIRKKFHRCQIVGRRFPICRVHIKGSVVEVSSFQTVAKQTKIKEEFLLLQMPKGCDNKDIARWWNCMHRDFTVNSLFFDPLVNKIYDYANAVLDLKSSKLRTLIPAQFSFEEDSARILRGLRLAARLNFSFSEETESAIHELSSSILNLAKSRILMELDYMLCYGAAEPSLCLLWRFHLLDILLPVQAAYLTQQNCKRSDQSPLMLMKLFSNLDQVVRCDRPSHGCLWIAIFAFHLALVNNPEQALVVLTFASVLYHGKWEEGVKFARQHAEAVHIYVPEILDCYDSVSDDELGKRITQFGLQVQNSVNVFTETDSLKVMMEKFPGFPCSGLVFVPKKMGKNAKQIFNVLVRNVTSLKTNRESLEIDYDSLRKGNLHEMRFVLGKVIAHALGCGLGQEHEMVREEKDDLHESDFQHKAGVLVENSLPVVDQRKHHSICKKDEKRNASDCDKDKHVPKKQKLLVNNSDLFKEGTMKNQKGAANKWPRHKVKEQHAFVYNDSCFEAKKHQRLISEGVGIVLQGHLGEMQEMVDSQQVPEEEIISMLGTVKQLRLPDVSVKDKPVDTDEYNQRTKKKLKFLKQANDKVMRKQQKSVENCNLLQESEIEQQAVEEGNKSILHKNGGASDRTVDCKSAKVKQKARQPTLSGLFSRAGLSCAFMADEKKEKE